MEDEEPRRQPTFRPRPESTIAQAFASDLDAMFGLISEPEVEHLSKTVEEKKETVNEEQRKLQELEARLRETEERLAKVSRHNSPSRPDDMDAYKPHYDSNPHAIDGASRTSPLAQRPAYPADRPPMAASERPPTERMDTNTMMSGMPGAFSDPMPHHYNASSEYVVVDRSAPQAQRGYG